MAGLVQKFKQMWTPPEDEYDYDFEEMDMVLALVRNGMDESMKRNAKGEQKYVPENGRIEEDHEGQPEEARSDCGKRR